MAEEDRTAEEDLAQTVVRRQKRYRGGNGYRGGNPSGRLDREIDRMNKETAASTEELRGKESREREKDRNKNDRQRNDYDALGGKKQERFVNLEKNGGKRSRTSSRSRSRKRM